MTKISVNLNKVALLRNARGGDIPDIRYIANLAIISGCKSFTLHPRKDERHATEADVKIISDLREVRSGEVEFNLEGDLREGVFSMIENYNVHQFTIVPVEEDEKTTQRGFQVDEKKDEILAAMYRLKGKKKLRFSLFIDPDLRAVEYAYSLGCDAIEINTKGYAHSFCTNKESVEVAKIQQASSAAREKKMRVHLGHDLSLVNVSAITHKIKPDEISVGHAMVVDSFLHGFSRTLKKYMNIASNLKQNSDVS